MERRSHLSSLQPGLHLPPSRSSHLHPTDPLQPSAMQASNEEEEEPIDADNIFNRKAILTDVLLDIPIMGEIRQICTQDLVDIPDLIPMDSATIGKIKDLGSLAYEEESLKMLNIFLYYCIKVSNNVALEGIEAHYQRLLREFYIHKKMNIDLPKFSHICARVLGLGARECAHIIYYLVYGRLATDCYVDAIMNTKAQMARVASCTKRQPKKSTIISIDKKDLSKRNLTIQSAKSGGNLKDRQANRMKENAGSALAIDNNKTSLEELAEQLHHILGHQSENQKRKKKGKNYQEAENEAKGKENWGWEGTAAEKKYYMSFYPNRVSNNEKSALLESFLPMKKSTGKLMRRRKFDHSAIEKMIERTYLEGDNPSLSENGDNKSEKEKISRRFMMGCSVKNANDYFKSEGEEFDKIRASLKERRSQPRKKPYLYMNNYLHTGNEVEFQTMMKKKKQSEAQNHSKTQQCVAEEPKETYEEENTYVNLLRKKPHKAAGAGRRNMKNNDQHDEGAHRLNQSAEETKKGSSLGMSDSQCRSRLFHYKTEYRRFMKRHLIEI